MGVRRLAPGWFHRVGGVRFWVSRFRFRVSGSGCRVSSFGFRASGSRFRISGSGFRVSGYGFRIRVSGLKYRVSAFGSMPCSGRRTEPARNPTPPKPARNPTLAPASPPPGGIWGWELVGQQSRAPNTRNQQGGTHVSEDFVKLRAVASTSHLFGFRVWGLGVKVQG